MATEISKLHQDLTNSIISGEISAARDLTSKLLEMGANPLEAVEKGASAMNEVGRRWECREFFLPEVMLAAEAMKASMELLLPKLSAEDKGKASLGKVVIGTAMGDIHDIGKSLVATMLAVEGFQVIDLGTDVPPKTFIETAEKEGAKIIAMSSLLTTSLPFQSDVIKYLEDTGKRDQYFILAGGGCVTPEWVRKARADGYARLAVGAARLARKLASNGHKPPLPEPLIEE